MSNYPSYGNDIDRVTCSFYQKIGACRHGDRCSRNHNKPTTSTVVMCPNLYRNPSFEAARFKEWQEKEASESKDEVKLDEAEIKFKSKYGDPTEPRDNQLTKDEIQREFDDFFKDIFIEFSLKFGPVDELIVTENFNHLNGNVYVRFQSPESAAKLVDNLNSRWYDGKPVFAELSPVQSFDDATCGSFLESGGCSRLGNCNFWHVKRTSPGVTRLLYESQGV